jgi:hypothetical protein
MNIPVKLCIVGPQKTGKTALANLIAEFSEVAAPEYQPTAGVRYVCIYSGEENRRAHFVI